MNNIDIAGGQCYYIPVLFAVVEYQSLETGRKVLFNVKRIYSE